MYRMVKCNQIETVTQCTEWCQFVVDFFFDNLPYCTGGFRSWSISFRDHQYTLAAITCSEHRPICSSVTVISDAVTSQPIHLLLLGQHLVFWSGNPRGMLQCPVQTEFLFLQNLESCFCIIVTAPR